MTYNDYMAAIILIAWIPLCILVGIAARGKLRSSFAWFLLAFLFSPFVAFIFLMIAGVSHSAAVRIEKEASFRRQHPERSDVRDMLANEMACPKCGSTVNPTTGDGLHSREDEPWVLLCDSCECELSP